MSKFILIKYRPEIIGITGSVGKTSAKLAVAHVLSREFKVRASGKNYNTEIGVPLAIIGRDNPGKSIIGWISVFLSALRLLFFKDKEYANILILEMAADKKGDIRYLAEFTRPKVAVITGASETHLEFIGTVEDVLKEKASLLDYIAENGCAILNFDDARVFGLQEQLQRRVIGYGLGDRGQVRASHVVIDKDNGDLKFILSYQDKQVQVAISQCLGRPAIYAALAGASVGLFYGMDISEIAANLSQCKGMPGRLRLLDGIKNTRIIDDTYNSSPVAIQAALEVLVHLNCTGDKFAVLGDMLELGVRTPELHRAAGESVASMGIDYLITVGERSKDIALGAKEYGMNEDRIYSFDDTSSAGNFLQDKISEGDLVLVKGSRGMHCEAIVKEIMAEPGRAEELLVNH